MNLILCGMMGCGKTTVGKALAESLAWGFFDTDERIVDSYGEISEIFKQYGEDHFRRLEKEVVHTLVKKDRLVISTGGGLVLDEENVACLKDNGKVIYLQAKKETLVERLTGDSNRPLLEGEEALEEKIDRLLEVRAEVYERIADKWIEVDEKTPDEVVKEILAKIAEMGVTGTK